MFPNSGFSDFGCLDPIKQRFECSVLRRILVGVAGKLVDEFPTSNILGSSFLIIRNSHSLSLFCKDVVTVPFRSFITRGESDKQIDMDQSIFCPVKFTEHRKVTKKLARPLVRPKRVTRGGSSSEINDRGPRVVRISVTDADATDSSGDEEGHLFHQRVKKYVNEICIESCSRTSGSSNGGWTNRSVRKDRQNSAGVSDTQVRPDALTNFATPPPAIAKPENMPTIHSGHESGEESHIVSSPTSVLQFSYTPNEEAEKLNRLQSTLNEEVEKPNRLQPVKEEVKQVQEMGPLLDAMCDLLPLDTPFLNDFFNFQTPAPELFDDISFPEFREDFGDIFFGSTEEDLGSSMWQIDDYFQEIGDLFVPDTIVGL
ncbi:hypothetical protein HHK36_000106 [Tetracentron sinense]|uniref:Uncharacterized protein n=1 Tax=Tetracentron sinense TaxID=13715 RepID=A0A834ZVC1_TETSI|nr:hypothetical protein HHK36_000106 [Tetracentron sinense]